MPTLPTAFVALQGAKIRLDGAQLRIEHPNHPPQLMPIGHIGALVTLGAVECTTAAHAALAQHSIACVHATRGGTIKMAVCPWTSRGFAFRAAQHRVEAQRIHFIAAASHPSVVQVATHPTALTLARSIIAAKVGAILGLLAQHQRTHDDVDLARPIAIIRAFRHRLIRVESIDQLRGYEGAATAQYFGAFPALCRGELTTSRRTRRPPRDPLNAALSFGYALLTNEMHATIIARGLEPTLGILHPPSADRPSLALDLIEPLRHAIIDRMVLRAANLRALQKCDFEELPLDDSVLSEKPDIDPDPSIRDDRCPSIQPHTSTASKSEDSLSNCIHATVPRTLFRFTDNGRRKFLSLYHETMEGTLHAADGSSTPVRALISRAVEDYERALDSQAGGPTPAEAKATEAEAA